MARHMVRQDWVADAGQLVVGTPQQQPTLPLDATKTAPTAQQAATAEEQADATMGPETGAGQLHQGADAGDGGVQPEDDFSDAEGDGSSASEAESGSTGEGDSPKGQPQPWDSPGTEGRQAFYWEQRGRPGWTPASLEEQEDTSADGHVVSLNVDTIGFSMWTRGDHDFAWQ
jgi:hypothetical protein